MSIIRNDNKILHGGDYNPDQWLDEPGIIDEDFKLMDKAFCNTFSIGIFSWGQIEIEEGKFDFSWLDDIFDRAAKSGKKLFLATPSAARPGWLAEKYPETNITDRTGFRQPWHDRQTACLNNPIFLEKVRNIDLKLAERYHAHPALGGWHISNEFSVECFCPECLAKFHEFLKDRYKTLENLNRHYWSAFWSHRFTSWNQPDPRDHSLNIVRLDWMRFITQTHVRFYRHELDAIRQFSDAPATTNMMGLYGHLDYWKIAEQCDFIADDCYPTWYPEIIDEVAANFAALHDMHYSMLDKPFLMMESCPGIPNYKPYVRLRRPNEFQREMLLALGHGADGTMYFQWRKGRGNCEQLHGAVVGHDGTDKTMMFRDVSEYGKHLSNIAGIVDSARQQDIAVVLDWEARWCLDFAAVFQGKDGKKTDRTIFEHYQVLFESNADIAVIDSGKSFFPYKMVVAPMLYLLKDGVAEKMDAFVKNGGTLVLTYLSAYADASNRCFMGGNPGGKRLRELFGIWNEDIDGLTPDVHQTIRFKGREWNVSGFAEYLHAEGAEVLGTYGSEFYAGTPAVTVKRYDGNGKAVYIGARTGLDFLRELYADLMKEAGVKPVLENLPPEVRVSRRFGKNETFFFLLNMSDREISFELPFAMTDIWNGKTEPQKHLTLPAAGSTVMSNTAEKTNSVLSSSKR